jgi:hypothetical protein
LNKKTNSSNKNSNSSPSVSISSVRTANENSEVTTDVKIRVDSLYLELLNFELSSDLNTVNLRQKITNSHIYISDAINELNNACAKAVKVCDDHANRL